MADNDTDQTVAKNKNGVVAAFIIAFLLAAVIALIVWLNPA